RNAVLLLDGFPVQLDCLQIAFLVEHQRLFKAALRNKVYNLSGGLRKQRQLVRVFGAPSSSSDAFVTELRRLNWEFYYLAHSISGAQTTTPLASWLWLAWLPRLASFRLWLFPSASFAPLSFRCSAGGR